MPVKRRIGKTRHGSARLSAAQWNVLTDRPDDSFEAFLLRDDPDDAAGLGLLWDQFGDEVLRRWIAIYPASRPRCWWRFAAPEPRQRLGGSGRTWASAYPTMIPVYELGLPRDTWLDIDPHDPPQFESQAAYLERLGLFEPGERARLKPIDFAPEVTKIPADKPASPPVIDDDPVDDMHRDPR